MAEGIVSSIQRFSLHDGPGIRTTVFLQGCQLNCAWCHNPEMIPFNAKTLWFEKKCIRCGACVDLCPLCAERVSGEAIQGKLSQCVSCGKCIEVCPTDALALAGGKMSSEEVMKEILEDLSFYGSDGGVTLSGGEPVLQTEFSREILSACAERSINAAIETNLDYEWKLLEELLPFIDLLIFDLKIMDTNKHKRYAGNSNERILDNIRRLSKNTRSMIARTPLIAGVNDSEENIEASTELLAALPGLLHYELLPYHRFGEEKQRALGVNEYDFDLVPEERARTLAGIAGRAGINVKVI
jgi:pyruvate formate lyase activating enzyme